VANSENWDGSSWTEVGDLNAAVRNHGGAGTSAAAVSFAGYTSTNVASTEEFTSPLDATVTFDLS